MASEFLAHSFRLRRPWECEAIDTDAVRYSRVFHRPTGIEPGDAIWLVASGLPEQARVWVNEQLTETPPDAGRGQYEITGLLADANRIVIECPGAPAEEFPFDVRLGIVGCE
ncbi:hypothetical protein OAS39_09415 [Pirellulales bacterium]|nr:hypothetical protein [Pirellulales bacterium]